jgi:two-component system, NarL family, invasion response regulator UvrY
MLRILVCDDHAVVRQGLKAIFTAQPDVAFVGEASSAHEVRELVSKHHWDVLVLDISLPGRSGLEVLQDLKRERAKLPVLVLSVHPEDEYGIRALKAGASGYLTKEAPEGELIKAIRTVAVGRKYITPSLGEKLARYLERPSERPLHEVLSDREYQVMCMIAAGESITKIGERLNLSMKTVSSYRSRILRKLQLTSTAAIIRYVIEHKIGTTNRKG